jgi:small subunit ribosomal protein S15
MEKAKKTEIIAKYARKEGDVGSTEVQIALLSARITEITDHMRANKKDHSSRYGLMALVNRRKRLLKYLAKENHARYLELADEFGIRGARI